MRLKRRLDRLQQLVGRPGDVSWEQYAGADRRASESTYAKIVAVVDDLPLPLPEPEREVDGLLIRRWFRQQGVDFDLACSQAINEFERRIAILGSEG